MSKRNRYNRKARTMATKNEQQDDVEIMTLEELEEAMGWAVALGDHLTADRVQDELDLRGAWMRKAVK